MHFAKWLQMCVIRKLHEQFQHRTCRASPAWLLPWLATLSCDCFLLLKISSRRPVLVAAPARGGSWGGPGGGGWGTSGGGWGSGGGSGGGGGGPPGGGYAGQGCGQGGRDTYRVDTRAWGDHQKLALHPTMGGRSRTGTTGP